MKQNYYFKKVGQYNLIKEIGAGSFARVFKGRSDVSNEEVAVKMISKQTVRTENIAVIEKEIDILLKLEHPNVIRLLDFKKTSNHYYLIFEYCEHGDLDNYIRKNSDNGKLPESEVRNIVQQIAKAMQKMHSLRMVHRDLKLANILVNKSFQIKLADFGFAKYSEDNSFLTSYCGTPITMAPEVLKREKYTDKCDIWSLGIIIFQMLYGMAPFMPPKGGMITDLLHVIETQELQFPEQPVASEHVKLLITGMLKKDWRQRISCLEFFQCEWLKEKLQGQENIYLQSILRNQQMSPKTTSPIQQQESVSSKHKQSEDIFEQENIQDKEDGYTDQQKETQVKYIAYGISNEIQIFLQSFMDQIISLENLCQKLQILNNKMGDIKELRSLILSIKLLKGQRLQQGMGYRREQIVVLQNSSSRSDLISLQITAPTKTIYDQFNQQLLDLQVEFFQQEDALTESINSHLSIADNIYQSFLDFLGALLKHEKLFIVDKEIVDQIFELLSLLAQSPPIDTCFECRISLQSTSDMKKFWYLFKLIKGYQQQLQTFTEDKDQSPNLNAVGQELQVKFSSGAIPMDTEEAGGVSFGQSDLSHLKNGLLEQMKQQTMIVIS